MKELHRPPRPPRDQTSAQARYITDNTNAAQRLRAVADDEPHTILRPILNRPEPTMSLTSYVSESDLFRQVVKRRTLKHPTAAAFNRKDWLQAFAALSDPGRRDLDLLLAAVYLGDAIVKLRAELPAILSEPFTREGGTLLLVAMANEQFLVVMRKSIRSGRRLARAGGMANLEEMAQRLIPSPTGQSMSGDDLVTHLIDTLPHWLHHLRELPADKPSKPIAKPFEAARNALMAASIERGLRDLWHQILWEGRAIVVEDDARHVVAHDEALDERWLTWGLREQANKAWEVITDMGAVTAAGRDAPPAVPVQPRTVVGVERIGGRKPRIVIGRADGRSPRQRAHVSERDMLQRLYTGIFLDQPLPATGELRLTCRELCRAWWLLKDLGEVLIAEIGSRTISDEHSMRMAACTWPVETIENAMVDALGIGTERAKAILRFFILDPPSTSSLFDQSLWWTPLVSAAHGRSHLLLAPLFIGDPVRLVEHWLEVGGISDQRKVKGRGLPFESHVRAKLSSRITGNCLVKDGNVLLHGLKRKGESEEIDLLVRIGGTVLVGEVKCFLSPVEPSDRFNYLLALEDAAGQARRKLAWVDQNRATTLAALGIDESGAAKTALLPVVVLNQGIGIGLSVDGVPIVDLHYLSLLLGSSTYQAETGFTAGGVAGAVFTFYRSQGELEARLRSLLNDPPPLRRYSGAIDWKVEPFPSPDGKPLLIHVPRLVATPANPGAASAIENALNRNVDRT